MSELKTIGSTIIFLFITLPALPQCFPTEGNSPAFEFNIPGGVTITSVIVKIENFERRGYIRGRIRSFQDLGHAYFDGDGEYEVLATPISGPSTQDLQLQSGIDYTCGYLEDSVGFDWQIIITATGLSGTNLNYTGSLTDNLAIPTYIGKIYDGNNLVSGFVDKKQEGSGVAVYPDNDHDGFGDASSNPVLVCNEYCPFSTSTNNLDCDDFNSNINPDQQEIPDNGLDDDCDGRTDCIDNSFSYNSTSFCHTDPNPIPITVTSGGVFSSSPGVVLDTSTGEMDLANSIAGVYTITYTTSGTCSASASFDIEINEVQAVSSLSASEITQNGFMLNWDNAPQANSYLVELDDDPSFESIDLSGNIAHTDTTFFSLSPGTAYAVRVAAIGVCGTGPYASLNLTTAVDPLATDSLALVALYHATDGDHWNRNDNWLTGPLESWYGIDMFNSNRVQRISLFGNNLTGGVPKEINSLAELGSCDLGNNNIHSIPDSLFFFNSKPISAWMGNNRLTFEDLVNQPKFFAKLYNQQKVGIDTTVYLKERDTYNIELGIDELVPDNEYVWMRDSIVIATTNINRYTITDFRAENAGVYTCRITNPRAQEHLLVLRSHPTALHIIPNNEDPSLAISTKKSCVGESLNFSASGRNGYETYSWSLLTDQGIHIGLPDSLRRAQSFSYALTKKGKYRIELTLSNQFDSDTILVEHINVYDKPEITLPESINLSTDSVVLTAVDAALTDTSTLGFIWYKIVGTDTTLVEGANTLWVNEAGLYKVTVINSTGCQAYAETLVIDARLKAQKITFEAITDKTYGDAAFALKAAASSGLPITYTFSGPLAIAGNLVSLLDSGKVTITASQAGNEFYLPAEPISHTFNITRKAVVEAPLDTLHQINIKIDTQLSDVYPLKVILYQQENGAFRLVKQESISASQLSWDDLPEGAYTLKVKSENRLYLPTYLGQKLLLSEAQPFTLTQDTEVSLHPISIPQVLAEIGVRLSGVFVQTSKADNGRVQIIKNTQVDGSPIVGLTIFLLSAQNQKLVATAITDGEGEFTFPHVPAGTYQVKVDYEGLSLDASTTFAVGSQNLSLSLMAGKKISLNAKTEEGQQVTGIREDILSHFKFYPNPVEDQLYLEAPAELVGGTLEIFDSRGKRVYTSTILTSKLSGSLAHLSSGYYQLQISHKGDTFSQKMLKR